MTLQKYIIVLLIVLIGVGGFGSGVQAQSITDAQLRMQLLAQIELLIKEVERLQAIVARQQSAKVVSYTPYRSVYFPLDFESLYLVNGGQLYAIGSESGFANADVHLFELFKSVVGKSAVDKYVQEWRVFENKSNDLGAFVELIAGTDKWVVGVNRESFDKDDAFLVKSYANLFVHEYAHILLFEEVDLVAEYENKFWSAADYKHESAVAAASARNRFSLLQRYYEDNTARFVSDYATMNPDEDMAETFVSFIKEAKPTGNTIREQKILFFYQYKDFVALRLVLRENLKSLEALN